MKALDEVEPRTAINQQNTPGDANACFVISVPGSYYLTENSVGDGIKRAIRIESSDVSIDLNGFSLRGPGPAAIDIPNDRDNVRISNGTVTDWFDGLLLGGGSHHTVSDLIVSDIGGFGVICGNLGSVSRCTITAGNTGVFSNAGATVRDCSITAGVNAVSIGGTVESCDVSGSIVQTFDGGVVRDCTVMNIGTGIQAVGTVEDCTVIGGTTGIRITANPGVIRGCTVRDASSFGIEFIGTAQGCLVENCGIFGITSFVESATLIGCTVVGCGNNGISMSFNSTIESCVTRGNGGAGIFTGSNSVVTACTADSNASEGIFAGSGSTITACTASLNSNGIVSSLSRIVDCSATSNTNFGFRSFGESAISGCSATQNASGFFAERCKLENCIASLNDNAGFNTTGSTLTGCVARANFFGILDGKRIEACNVSTNVVGITVGADAVVLNNLCEGNSGDTLFPGVGIDVTGQNTRVDGNTTNNNEIGIRSSAGRCVIVRNDASDNTTSNYSIGGAGNTAGAITANAITAGPWDNFSN